MLQKSFYYRVICKPVGKGLFSYFVPDSSVEGRSREPLLDTCRQLKRMGASTSALVALYYEGSPVWTLRCPIGRGAELTVSDGYFKKLPAEYNA